MFSFLTRGLPATGRVLYPGAICPPAEALTAWQGPLACTRIRPSEEQVWALTAAHPRWGTAEIAALRPQPALSAVLIEHTIALSDDEKARARTGQATVAVRVQGVRGDKVDATLANAPHRVPSLTLGQRGEFGLERLTDWMVQSPEGPMTPRNVSAARRLRTNREMWQARLDSARRADA